MKAVNKLRQEKLDPPKPGNGAAPNGVPTPNLAAARSARLRYVGDWQPGISRRKRGKAFTYINVDGRRLTDPAELRRIKALAIPPAWTHVWICPRADGHLQAVGRDARGRKQYRYHARWREVRDENKYARMGAFAKALPRVRAQVERDLARPGLPREKVLAAVVKLLECTCIRVGNEEYAQSNRSFGLATFRDRHVQVSGPKIQFDFRGKSGIAHAIRLEDPRLARLIKRCQDLPGYELFQYLDETGRRVAIEASDVNEYLREVAGEEIGTKDFRTWAGTVLAAAALRRFAAAASSAERKRNVVQAVDEVAKILGNTKAVCRKCYIHPAVIDAYTEDSLVMPMQRRVAQRTHHERRSGTGSGLSALTRLSGCALSPHEAAVLALLKRWNNASGHKSGRQASLRENLRQSIKAANGSSARRKLRGAATKSAQRVAQVR